MTNPDREELVKLADTITGHVAALANEPLRMPLTTWNVVSNDILAAAESLRRLASSDGVVNDVVLCCDVRLPPITTIRAGCKVSTLMAAISMRESWPEEDRHFIAQPPAVVVKGEPEPVADWRDDPTSDERWNAGCDFAMTQLCKALDVDPATVNWDAATETVDGDVQSVIWNILRARMGEDWDDPDTAQPADAGMREALERLKQGIRDIAQACVDGRVCDDVAWFTEIPAETLFDKCCNLLGEDLPTGQPTRAAPGATTKSDGDAESKLVAPALEKHSTTFDREVCQTASRPSEQSGQVQSAMQNPEAGVAPRPSDANSGNAVELFERHTGLKLKITDATRSEVTVESLADWLNKRGSLIAKAALSNPGRHSTIDLARALLDQFEIRRK